MTWRRHALAVAAAGAGIIVALSCTEIPTEENAVLSISLDSLPAPAVVLGDTLRDTTGQAVAIRPTVYNFKGGVVTGAPVRFQALDRGVRIDSITGFAIGDSLRQTPVRIAVSVDGVQLLRSLDVTLRPDTVTAVNAVDSLLYSLTDSTKNFSPGLQVRVLHSLTSADSAVKSYLVSFAVVAASDPLLGVLVNEAGKPSRVDTTDASGVASRRIQLSAVRLTALTDSIIVNATVKYLGAQLRGSPVRLVLRLKPGPP